MDPGRPWLSPGGMPAFTGVVTDEPGVMYQERRDGSSDLDR